MYKFICENNHISHSAAKEQKNPGCPTCGAASELVDEECGCGGKIKQGAGCLAYLDSDEHVEASAHESMMRAGGLGFGTAYFDDSSDAMMSMHLQANGLEPDAVMAILQKKVAKA